jgi:hypothetical protein
MRPINSSFALAAAVVLSVAACAPSDKPTSPLVAGNSVKQGGVPDVSELPDLIVDSKATQNNWIVRVEDLPAGFCSVEEGNITPGEHTLLRFTVTTPNIGKGDVFVGSPLQHYNKGDGLFEFATCHQHFHFTHYATYRLIDKNGKTWKAAKRGFCMLDTDPFNTNSGDGRWTYRNCGTLTADGFQGISSGWADTYVFKLGGQYFLLDGGDGQPPVPPGVYTIRVEVNPAYVPDNGGPCLRFIDPDGKCRQFKETNYANNVGEATVIITDHPGRSGYGTIKDKTKITAADEIEK